MAQKSFIRENFALVLGLTLPVLMMIGFMIASHMPETVKDPPKYSLVFSVSDNSGINPNNLPISVRLVVKDGILKAQYTEAKAANGYYYNTWKKLYIFDADAQKVRELTFGLPTDMAEIKGMREETVAATKNFKLDTTLQSPDGYELSYDGYSSSGLVGELFWNNHYSSEPRLRKGSSSVRLSTSDKRNFYYSQIEFLGWVIDQK